MREYFYSPIWGIIHELDRKSIYIKIMKNRHSFFSPISGILTKINNLENKSILEFICEGKKLKITLDQIELYHEIPTIVIIGQHLGEIKLGDYCEIEFEDLVYFLVEKYQNVFGGISSYPLGILL